MDFRSSLIFIKCSPFLSEIIIYPEMSKLWRVYIYIGIYYIKIFNTKAHMISPFIRPCHLDTNDLIYYDHVTSNNLFPNSSFKSTFFLSFFLI